MPNGLYPARGDVEIAEAIASSAFSKGDLLMFDSNSSLSRMPFPLPADDIAGVAASDSVDSFDQRCRYFVPQPGQRWFSDATPGSQFTPGEEFDFGTDGNGRPVLVTSQSTVRFVVEVGSEDVLDQSTQSRVIGQLIRHAGNLDLS